MRNPQLTAAAIIYPAPITDLQPDSPGANELAEAQQENRTLRNAIRDAATLIDELGS